MSKTLPVRIKIARRVTIKSAKQFTIIKTNSTKTILQVILFLIKLETGRNILINVNSMVIKIIKDERLLRRGIKVR